MTTKPQVIFFAEEKKYECPVCYGNHIRVYFANKSFRFSSAKFSHYSHILLKESAPFYGILTELRKVIVL